MSSVPVPGAVDCLTFRVFGSFDLFDAGDNRFGSPRQRLAGSFSNRRESLVPGEVFTMDSSSSSQQEDSEEDQDRQEGELSSDEVCPFYVKGACRFRKSCRLSHDIGEACPHCLDDLPSKWTLQSKHLKKCYQDKIEEADLEDSKSLTCASCNVVVLSKGLLFGLLANCEHCFCELCARKFSEGTIAICPKCSCVSDCVLFRDRIMVDDARKSKAFGLFRKKKYKLCSSSI